MMCKITFLPKYQIFQAGLIDNTYEPDITRLLYKWFDSCSGIKKLQKRHHFVRYLYQVKYNFMV